MDLITKTNLQPTISVSNVPRMSVEVITPAIAEEMLKHNSSNRPIKRSQVVFLTNEILTNRWITTGQAITFVGKTLVDGQHRLQAVIEADKAITSCVIRFPSTANTKQIFQVTDRGVPRTFSDVLAIQGEIHVNVLTTVLLGIERYYQAIDAVGSKATTIPYSSQTSAANKTIRSGGSKAVTHKKPLSHIAQLLERYPFARKSAAFGQKMHKARPQILMKGQWGLLHAIYTDIDEGSALTFLELLQSGENLSRHSPILQLRERMLSIRTDKTRDSHSIGSQVILALSNAAWNAYRTDKTINLKKVSAGDAIQIAK